jgi:hypothetical protein
VFGRRRVDRELLIAAAVVAPGQLESLALVAFRKPHDYFQKKKFSEVSKSDRKKKVRGLT